MTNHFTDHSETETDDHPPIEVVDLREESSGEVCKPAVLDDSPMLADELEKRQDDVIIQLDELNHRIENLIELYTRLRQQDQVENPEPLRKAG